MAFEKSLPAHCNDANGLDKKLILDFLKGKKFEKILDTGCGAGDFTLEVGKLVNAKEVHGVELEDEAFKSLSAKKIKMIRADLNGKLPYKNENFDLIISTQNIEHLYFTDDYLQEMRRVLKKNGSFVLTTVNIAAIHYRIMMLFGIAPICLHPSEYQTWPLSGRNPRYGHKSVFAHRALGEVLRKHKFKIVKQYTHTIYFIPQILSQMLCKLFPSLGTFSCYIVKKNNKKQ